MRNPEYLHLAALTRDYTEHLISLGLTEKQLLGGSGYSLADITPAEAMVPMAVTADVFNRGAKLLRDDLVHVKWAQNRKLNRLGVIGYLGRSAATVRSLTENMARYQRVYSEVMEIDVAEVESKGIYRWANAVPASMDTSLVAEAQVIQFVSGLRKLAHNGPNFKRVTFTHHRAKNREVFAKYFDCPVSFDMPANTLVFRLGDLAIELDSSDEELHKILRRHCDLVLQQTPHNRSDIRVQVEGRIADRLASGDANIEMVSRDLGMSSRTLARRLGEVDTTYQKVLSGMRQSLAERYLKDGNMSQTEIAFLLGYSDVSSFASAFKRWTGHSPGDMRRTS